MTIVIIMLKTLLLFMLFVLQTQAYSLENYNLLVNPETCSNNCENIYDECMKMCRIDYELGNSGADEVGYVEAAYQNCKDRCGREKKDCNIKCKKFPFLH